MKYAYIKPLEETKGFLVFVMFVKGKYLLTPLIAATTTTITIKTTTTTIQGHKKDQ